MAARTSDAVLRPLIAYLENRGIGTLNAERLAPTFLKAYGGGAIKTVGLFLDAGWSGRELVAFTVINQNNWYMQPQRAVRAGIALINAGIPPETARELVTNRKLLRFNQTEILMENLAALRNAGLQSADIEAIAKLQTNALFAPAEQMSLYIRRARNAGDDIEARDQLLTLLLGHSSNEEPTTRKNAPRQYDRERKKRELEEIARVTSATAVELEQARTDGWNPIQELKRWGVEKEDATKILHAVQSAIPMTTESEGKLSDPATLTPEQLRARLRAIRLHIGTDVAEYPLLLGIAFEVHSDAELNYRAQEIRSRGRDPAKPLFHRILTAPTRTDFMRRLNTALITTYDAERERTRRRR